MAALSGDEHRLVDSLLGQLASFQTANLEQERHYAGKFVPPYLTAGLPEYARNLRMVVGWPRTVVDVLEERLDVLGWDDDRLDGVFLENALPVEASQVHREAFVFGVGFMSVTAGGGDEPEVLVRAHSPKTTTGLLNQRSRRLDAALTRQVDADHVVRRADLWLKDQVVVLTRAQEGSPWEVVERRRHGFGRVPLVAFVNQPRVSKPFGTSEITPGIISATHSATRALTAMDVNRAFYSAPRMYGVNVEEDMFTDATGQAVNPWQLVTGRMLMAPPPDEVGAPEVRLGQFDPISPGPYLEQIKGLSQQVAAEAAIPPSYLGFVTENPSSADAIRQMEARLVKRAERRQTQFSFPWSQVGQLVQMALGAESDSRVRVKWAEASTPTLAATTDALVKGVQAGIYPPGSSYVMDQLRISQSDQEKLQAEWARERSMARSSLLSRLEQVDGEASRAAAANRPPDEETVAPAS